ncbi:MAG: bacteriohopanetetrol glucosamine biosynthesis glycosyltransferase HpnI [Steroidobacteraceae bacterium]|jgi:ceramide glucosyltransferase
MPLINPLIAIIGFASLGLAASYAVLALVAVVVWQIRRAPTNSRQLPPVTVLKPLCGAEPGLYENLRSFCKQDYPEFQIVFGVRDLADPALSVVERLLVEFPSLPIDVVVNPQQHGSNCKISNLINMIARARHDVLAMADSDACVGPDYLSTVTAPLLDHNVGLVTCLYRGVPTQHICSRLGAMYINEWYMPSVLVAWLFGYQGYASGQTLCLRRDTLQSIGGLQTMANHLAEDHRLGEMVRGSGLRIVLSPYVLKAEHHEPNLDSLTRHEVRWMRTIRVLRPRSFRMIFLSFSLPLAILGIMLAGVEPSLSTTAWALFGTTVIARLLVHFVHRLRGDRPLLSDLWLLPARDLLIWWVWCRSFFSSRVTWRGSEFEVDANGIMRRLS